MSRTLRSLLAAVLLTLALIAGSAIAPAQAAPSTVVAKLGDRTAKAYDVQLRLITLGYLKPGSADGWFGPMTKTAVIAFQKAYKRPSTDGRLTEADFYVLWQKSVAKRAADAKPTKVAGLDSRCLTGRAFCVNKTTRKGYYVVNGKVVKVYAVRTGMPGYATREGSFPIAWKSRNHVSNIYNVSMPFAMFFSGGQAIHYSAQFASSGYQSGSHGCVNLNTWSGAEWLFGQLRVGDRVVVYR